MLSPPLLLLIVGIILLVLAYYVGAPPPAKAVMNVFGWILTIIGGILLLLALLGVSAHAADTTAPTQMDAYQLAYAVFATPWVRLILGLIGANALLGISTALFSKRYTFYLASTADWMLSRVLPFVIGWGAVKLVAMTALADYRDAANATEALVSAFVVAALLGKIGDQLRDLGMPIPVWAGDKPKPTATVSP